MPDAEKEPYRKRSMTQIEHYTDGYFRLKTIPHLCQNEVLSECSDPEPGLWQSDADEEELSGDEAQMVENIKELCLT